jgi:hypothetical protein
MKTFGDQSQLHAETSIITFDPANRCRRCGTGIAVDTPKRTIELRDLLADSDEVRKACSFR